MNEHSPLRLLLLALAVTPPATRLAAQHSPPGRTVGGGLSFQDDSRVTRTGVHLEGAYSVSFARRQLAVRLEGGAHYFPGSGTGAACAPATVCGGTAGTMTLLRGGASLVMVQPMQGQGALYWIAGVGVYRVTDRPPGDPYTRFGWNVGFGVRVSHSAYGELRYHEASGTQSWRHLTPLTIGYRF